MQLPHEKNTKKRFNSQTCEHTVRAQVSLHLPKVLGGSVRNAVPEHVFVGFVSSSSTINNEPSGLEHT